MKENQDDLQDISAAENKKILANQIADLEAQIKALTSFPPIKPMKGKCVKANFYATQEALDLFNKVVDMVVEMYGFKRYFAVSFVLEEAIRRLGVEVDKN